MRRLFILFVAFFAATTLLAQTFQSGNLYYKVTSAAAPYEVEVTYDESYSTLTTVSIPESVTNGGISYAVTAIGTATFYNCYQLQKVTIPISVTKIANNAFETAGIYNMESWWEDNMLYIDNCLIEARGAFVDEEQLQTNYVIKEGTRIIADGAFSTVHALSTIELPSSLTHIGANALNEANESLDTIRVNAITPPILGSYAIGGNPICYIPYGTLGLYQNTEWANQVGEFVEDTTIIGDNIILYTTNNNSIVTPGRSNVFGANIVSNTYNNGRGEIIFDAPVTSIGDFAFYYKSNLSSITIPKSVTSIGNNTFASCSSLSTITIPESVSSIGNNTFASCSSLSTITIPESVTSIGNSTFVYCSSLSTITIPEGVTSIGQSAFSDCTSLSSITIPRSVTSIGSGAFQRCTSLSSITIPEGVRSIGRNFCASCSSLSSITIHESVTSIGSGAFQRCTSLSSIIIPESVTSIGDSVFLYCTKLSSITIPENVTTIGVRTFNQCYNLLSVIIPESVTSIGDYAFDACSKLPSITIPECLTSIGDYAFNACSKLSSTITIPEGVTHVGTGAFAGTSIKDIYWNAKDCSECGTGIFPTSQILSISFGKNVEYIPSGLCDGFSNIYTCTIPKSVKKIGDNAFANTSDLCIFIESEEPAMIGNSVVNDSTKQLMYVPNLDTYLTAWPAYKPYLKSIDEGVIDCHITAQPSSSALLSTIGASNVASVIKLKLNGTMNSYDIMVIRNRMPWLRVLDLEDVSIVANSYEYTAGYHSKNDTLTFYAFQGSTSGIRELILPKTLKYIEGHIVNNYLRKLTVHSGLSKEYSGSFNKLTELQSVYLSDSITVLPRGTFSGCTNLQQIRLPENLTYIGPYALQNTAIESITIPANVTTIGEAAFAGVTHASNAAGAHRLYYNSPTSTYGTSILGYTGEGKLRELIIPKHSKLKHISEAAFAGNNFEKITFGDSITSIGLGAFMDCQLPDTLILPVALDSLYPLAFGYTKGMKYIAMPNTLSIIHNNAFVGCSDLNKVQFPSTLTTIEHHAFTKCTNLSEVDVPGLVTSIGDYAFQDCNINTIYTYLFDPFTIGQNTFSAYVNANATLYVPNVDDVEMKYLYDTQWSQILNCKRMDRTFEYKDFYANGDVVIGENDESLNGNPNANLNPGSGLVVEEGENTQDLGKVTLSGSVDNWASLIAGCNTNVDTLELSLTVPGHKWHFIGFPFAVDIDNLHADHQFAIYEYDGEARATHGTTGWKVVPKSQKKLNPGHGYIIQFNTDTDCQFRIKVHQPNFCAMMNNIELKVYPSSKNNNKSWNYISNPYFAYYDINDLNYTGPITFWDIETGTYKSLRAGDDEYILSPYEAFFLQNIDENENFALVFDKNKGMTKNQSDAKKGKHAPQRQNVDAKAKRHIINISLSDDKHSDFTRLVINDDATTKYDMGMDAAKFMSTESIPQVFTYDAEHDMCAINERPMENGTIELGIKLPATGTYHFSASRMDTTFYLLDREMNITHDFTLGDYQFDGKAGNTTNRFALVRNPQNQPTDVENTTESTIDVVNDGLYVNGTVYLQIYNVSGVLILQGEFSGKVALEPGVYLVVNNGITSKYVIK